jgi:exodeoxyribonuclease VII large subunit
MRRRLQEQGERLRWLSGRASLVSPSARLKLQLSRLESLDQRLGRAWRQAMSSRREKLLPLIRTLQAVSPLATLERGYAIVSLEGGDILRDAADAKPGAIIEARLARGRVRAKVEEAS